MKYLMFTGLCFLLFSCCTKKDCDQEYNPEIIFSFNGFNSADLSKVSIIITDTNSFKEIDSVVYLYGLSNSLHIYNWMLNDKEIEIKDFNFIIKTNVSSDTIYRIKYKKYIEKIECNTCYPFGNGSATVINYKDLSYYYRQNKYEDKGTLVIQK